MFLTLWIIATVTFILVNAIPGDPIGSKAKVLPKATQEAIRRKYNLDKPEIVRYGYYLRDLAKGDLGVSITRSGLKVNDIIKKQFPVSAKLGLQAVILGLIIGLTFGIIAAFNRGRWPDYLVIFISMLGVTVPSFVFAILLQYFVGGKHGIPTAGWFSIKYSWFGKGFKYTILPTIALAVSGIASNARFMRTSVLDVVGQDYIMTARAKGISRLAIVWKHTLRNASIPVVTILGPRIAAIITGTIIIEQIFGIPGIGRELVSAIGTRDYTVVMSLTVFYSFIYVLSLLFVDIAYVIIDPRIRLTGKKA